MEPVPVNRICMEDEVVLKTETDCVHPTGPMSMAACANMGLHDPSRYWAVTALLPKKDIW